MMSSHALLALPVIFLLRRPPQRQPDKTTGGDGRRGLRVVRLNMFRAHPDADGITGPPSKICPALQQSQR